jgi:hypothetical protein
MYLKIDQRRDDREAVIADGLRVSALDELDLLRVRVVVQGLHAFQDVLGIAVLRVVKENTDLMAHKF